MFFFFVVVVVDFSLCVHSTSKHNQTVSLALTCKSLMSLGLVRNTNQMLRFSRLILASYSLKIHAARVGVRVRVGGFGVGGRRTDRDQGPENNLSQEAPVAK